MRRKGHCNNYTLRKLTAARSFTLQAFNVCFIVYVYVPTHKINYNVNFVRGEYLTTTTRFLSLL